MRPNSVLPPEVLEMPTGALLPITRGSVDLYLRETAWGVGRYPQNCSVEFRLGVWDLDPAFIVILMARFAADDARTFDRRLDVENPFGVQMLRALDAQKAINTHLVTDRIARTLRAPNTLRGRLDRLIQRVHSRPPPTRDQADTAYRRFAALYPTAPLLWWNCPDAL
ncbi:MAG: hypothetical protein IPM18_12390 [Phycisphaerales bacterium]|nr:hypothetical protein [Phycisphaerales bacterium]